MRLGVVLGLFLLLRATTNGYAHIAEPPVTPASQIIYRWPLICDPTLPNKVQFRWIAAPGETVDRRAVEERLHEIAEQVNWLFWRDSNHPEKAVLPAWAVTADCKLDILHGDAPIIGNTIPDIGPTKLIEITPQPDEYYCGWVMILEDDRPGMENVHNQPSFATVTRRCLGYYTVAHEFFHSIGAVQLTAPHSDGRFHSRQFDLMGPPGADLGCMDHDVLDCGRDDYFSLRPTGYLQAHWNSADSVFLASQRKYTLIFPLAFVYDLDPEVDNR